MHGRSSAPNKYRQDDDVNLPNYSTESAAQDAKSELRNGYQTETGPETRTAHRAKTLFRYNELGAGGGQRITAE